MKCTKVLGTLARAYANKHVCIYSTCAGAHKRMECVTSILYHSNQEVKSSASGCGVTQLDDYHIRLVCCSQMWPDGYDFGTHTS